MAIDYEKVMSLKTEDIPYSYTDRESMLYALGVGFGRRGRRLRGSRAAEGEGQNGSRKGRKGSAHGHLQGVAVVRGALW